MKPSFILLMGVSGSGKTRIGKLLATHLGWQFYEGDKFHTPENITKMSSGTPLNDDDRIPWLISLNKLISTSLKESRPGVLACSALKEQYRQLLLRDCQGVLIVYLKGSYDLIWSRMSARPHHYMKPKMLKSQFEALEEPLNALVIDISQPVEEIVGLILGDLARLG